MFVPYDLEPEQVYHRAFDLRSSRRSVFLLVSFLALLGSSLLLLVHILVDRGVDITVDIAEIISVLEVLEESIADVLLWSILNTDPLDIEHVL